MHQNSIGTQLLTLAIKVPHWLGTPMTLAFQATLKEPPPWWLCPIHFKIGIGKARCSRVLLPKASSFLTKRLVQVSLLSEGLEPDETSRTDAAVDRPHDLLLKGSNSWSIQEEPVQHTTTQETVVEALQLLEGLKPETTVAAVHDLLLQASQHLAVTGLAK